MTLTESKREMRARIRSARLELRPGEAQTRSSAVCSWVTRSPEFEGAKTLASYRAMPGEVMTDEIFAAAQKGGKTVLYPRVETGEAGLTFCVVNRLDEMVAGKWDILEPPLEAEVRPVSEADLLIVPGVAFDRKGGRLGQGGGFYDGILGRMPSGAVKMGVAYELQLVDEVPREPHDEKIYCLAVESGIIRFNSSGGEI